jgi:hypothetical protein
MESSKQNLYLNKRCNFEIIFFDRQPPVWFNDIEL